MPVITSKVEDVRLVHERLGMLRFAAAVPPFQAGQFMMIGIDVDGKYQKRAYSIVSSPYMKERVEFLVKAAPEGKVAPHILKLKPGDTAKLEGPFGKFVLNGSQKNKLFIAAGTGIAPIISMVRKLVADKFAGKIRVFYGASYPRDLVYSDELAEYSTEYGNVEFIPTISREDSGWTGERGRVESILHKYISGSNNEEVFICGPPPMVQNAVAFLKEKGFAAEDINIEQYY